MNADYRVMEILNQQGVSSSSRISYASVLRTFEAFLRKHDKGAAHLSISTLRAWVQADYARSSLPKVMYRVFIVTHYLDWLSTTGGGPNPLASLCQQYGRLLTPIIRALLETDFEQALDRLRPLPVYGSDLGPLIREHVARMQSLGCKYETKERDLRRFDRFLQTRLDLAGSPIEALLDAWRLSAPGLRQQLCVQQCGRTLTQALLRNDATTPILSIDVGLQRRVLREERKPYLFTDGEVDRLFDAARAFPTGGAPLRRVAVYSMLALAYCVGLRVGEIASLTVADVDLDDGLLEIRDTKHFKSRRLPVSPTVVDVLSRYLAARIDAGAPDESDAPLWWNTSHRKGYCYGQVEKLLTLVIRRAGLKPALGRCGPRVHDLRHSFVAHRMVRWYRDGVNVQNRLPYLATFLGHKDLQSTLVYLNVTPELLQQASERYRKHGVGALPTSGDRP